MSEQSCLSLDNSKRSCWKTCKRKYFFLYEKRIKPTSNSTALRYGQTWHSGLEEFYRDIQEKGWTRDGSAMQRAIFAMRKTWEEESARGSYYNDYRTLENCVKSFLQYVSTFAGDEHMLKVIQSEQEFKILMTPEANDVPFEPFHFTGKIDLVAELNDRRWIMEHKTTGQPLDTQVQRLHRSAQVMGYTYAASRIYKDAEAVEGALITIHYLSAYKSKTSGNYGEPKIDFRRSPQIFSKNDITQWRASFIDAINELRLAKKNNSFPMNHDNCFQFGACPYLQLCEQQTDLENIYLTPQFYIDEVEWNPGKESEVVI